MIGRLLRDPSFANTAVIVNELGEVGLDHDLIATGDETLLQLTTGCLCCAVRSDLGSTLADLLARQQSGTAAFTRVLIETSGLADPAPILHALMTDTALTADFAVAGVVTLLDCLLGAQTLAAHPEAQRQVAMADTIVLTKTDLIEPSEALLARVAALNPLAPVVRRAPDAAALFAPGRALLPDDAAMARHSAGVGAGVVRRTQPVPAAALALWVQALAEHAGPALLRVKGLVDLTESPGRPAVLQGVRHIFAEPDFLPGWPSDDHTTRLVVIGQDIPRHFPARLLDAIITEVLDEQGPRHGAYI